MKEKIGIIIAFIFEVSLLIVVVLFLLLGILGIFLPIIPGLILLGFAVAIYTFLLKDENHKLSHSFHRHLIKLSFLKNNKIYMGIIKTIKKRKEKKINQIMVKYGLILFGFNLILILFLFFLLALLNILAFLLSFSDLTLALVPLLVLFIFAAACSLIWYRFGQILAMEFKKSKVVYAGMVVLISVVPLLLILFVLGLMISYQILPAVNALATAFILTLLMTILAAVFEVFIVSLGAITKN